jgi:peptide subunit release factor 1 (eRF1)
VSLSVAKNAMHRAIKGLFHRPLSKKEKDLIWKYFKSRCAYCNKRIDRTLRHGHMDHLDCSADRGGNYIRNRVLACKECNGNEKRELNWQSFLKSKCRDANTFTDRKNRILTWQEQFPLLQPRVLSPNARSAEAALFGAITNFEEAFVRFRNLIR